MIPAEAIAEVKARHDIVAFIESCGVALKRHGEGFLGLCPLHGDTRPSLSVSPAKQSWCCLGACSPSGKVTGGDVIEFARRFWGVSFREALTRLGSTVSVDLPSPVRPLAAVRPLSSHRRAPSGRGPTDLLSRVAGVYHQSFLLSEKARDYAAARGLTKPDLLSALPIGYADGSLLDTAPEGSETWEALRALGVVTATGRELLSGCLVVPLRDLSGTVVSLYGRRVEVPVEMSAEPPDRPRHFYLPGPRRGLVNASCLATTDELILTESVIDALSFLEAGIPNAVPLYGTSGWTPDHDALLERHRVRSVLLALDADEAGRKAAEALSRTLTSRGLRVTDVLLPAKDPNALLVAEGPDGFRTTWKRLVTEAAREAARGAGAPAPAPQASGPRALEGPAAKEEKTDESKDASLDAASLAAPALVLDETGAYLLAFDARAYRVRGLSVMGVDRLRVNVRVNASSRFHVDTLDLYSSRARQVFAETAARTLALPEGSVADLHDELALLVDALEKERLSLRRKGTSPAAVEPAPLTPAAEAEAMALLRGDLLGRLREDFRAVGLVGEETALLIGYLALVSRKLREPLSILFCARSGAGKSALQDRLCDFCPPEDLVKYTRISGQVLFYKDQKALEHKLLAVDEEDGAAQAAYALRSLLSSGYLSCSVTRTDPQTGRQVADDRRVDGPTTVFLTSAHPEALDYETRNRFVLLTVDESREQTRRILALQRWGETAEGLKAREERTAVYRKHHDLQRLLKPLDVVIPMELPYPSGWLILRREQRKYLTLVKALALLHQHQRPRKTLTVDGRTVEYVEATQADVEIGRELSRLILRRNLDELSPPSRSLLSAMQELVDGKKAAAEKAGAATAARPAGPRQRPEPGPLSPSSSGRRYVLGREKGEEERVLIGRHELQKATGLSYWHVRTYLAQLVEYEYVALVKTGQGQKALYELLHEAAEEDPWAAA